MPKTEFIPISDKVTLLLTPYTREKLKPKRKFCLVIDDSKPVKSLTQLFWEGKLKGKGARQQALWEMESRARSPVEFPEK